MKISYLLGLSLCCVVACGGPNKALITQSEIDAANQNGTLDSLYRKAEQLAAQNSGSSKEEVLSIQANIAGLLVKQKSAEVDSLLSKQQAPDAVVTRSQLLAAKESIAPMQQWSATSFTRNQIKLDKAIQTVDGKIKGIVDKSEEPGVDRVDRLLILKEAATWAGEGQPETVSYQKALKQALEQYLYQGNDSLSKHLYGTALEAAKSGLALDPGNVQFESMQSQAQAGLFEKDFRFALEQGKPESAYQSFLNVVEQPIFLQLKKTMGKSIRLLANYFAGAAAQKLQHGNLDAAYEDLLKGRNIQQQLGDSNQGFIQEKPFLDQVYKRAKNPNTGVGKRQALLRVINEFDAKYPGLSSEYLKLSEAIKNRALTKLSVDSFKEVMTSDPVTASVGRRIGSKLEKILFDKLGNEVLIVTEAKTDSELAYQGLALKVDGEVLQAAIESKVNKGQRSKRVQTGVNRTETEEYTSWARRKRGEAPTRYNESPIMEDVILTVEHISKTAIAEVAFRIVEPASGKILLTDSFVRDGKYQGETINELQRGDFKQPYVPADLPSDIKIMDGLATELADTLGEKLGDYLKNSEQVFYHKFTEAKAKNDTNAAVELLANALLIAQGKSLDMPEWEKELKLLSLK